MDGLDIAVDPRIELLMTVQSTVREYWERGPLAGRSASPYVDAAFGLARSLEGHAAPALWRQLHAAGFTFDAPVRFALAHSSLPAFAPTQEYGFYLVQRAQGAQRLPRFAAALRDFAAASDFAGFADRWRPLYEEYEAQARSVVELDWPARLDAFAGRPPTDTRVVLAPLSRGSYGLWVGDACHSVVAPRWTDAGARFDDAEHLRSLVLHEGAHTFVNDAVFAVAGEVEASSRLLEPIARRMADQAYPRWTIVVCEHVVRAVVARLVDDADRVLAEEEARGFIYIRPVFAALGEYEHSRGAHPDFAAFAPRIAAVFRQLAEGAGADRAGCSGE